MYLSSCLSLDALWRIKITISVFVRNRTCPSRQLTGWQLISELFKCVSFPAHLRRTACIILPSCVSGYKSCTRMCCLLLQPASAPVIVSLVLVTLRRSTGTQIRRQSPSRVFSLHFPSLHPTLATTAAASWVNSNLQEIVGSAWSARLEGVAYGFSAQKLG